jgi:hypothetical protein
LSPNFDDAAQTIQNIILVSYLETVYISQVIQLTAAWFILVSASPPHFICIYVVTARSTPLPGDAILHPLGTGGGALNPYVCYSANYLDSFLDLVQFRQQELR